MKRNNAVLTDGDISYTSLLFVLIGVGYMFPFSALTQPVDYWHEVFPDFNIEFPLTTVFLWSNLMLLGLIVFSTTEPSYTFRIVGGFLGQLSVLIFVPSIYFLHLTEHVHFVLIMVATVLASFATAFVDSVAISFASQYPVRIQESYQFGVGFSTLIGSVYRIVTKLAFPPQRVVESSLLYFYCGSATIVLCIYAYYQILSLPISREYLIFGIQKRDYKVTGADAADHELSSNEGIFQPLERSISTTHPSLAAHYQYNSSEHRHYGSCIASTEDSESIAAIIRVSEPTAIIIDRSKLLRKIATSELVVFSLFFLTQLLWPPLVTEIRSFNFPYLNETKWYSLILLLLFAVSDCVGRLATSYRNFLKPSNLWAFVAIRFALFPLIVCSVKGYYFFTNDAYSMLFVNLLGFTNGYLGTISILFVNEIVEEHERGMAGTYTGFFLNLGLVCGGSMAFLLRKWIIS